MIKHGERKTRLYRTWAGMHSRCRPNSDCKNYGMKGIRVCAEWNEYIPFRNWARANGYTDGLVIHRIDSDQWYSPSNCRWVTVDENNQLKSTTIKYLWRGEMLNIEQIAKLEKISRAAARTGAVKFKLPIEQAVQRAREATANPGNYYDYRRINYVKS